MTGGYRGNYSKVDVISSTETLVEGASAWKFIGELPVAMYGLRGVSLNNKILIIGNIIIQKIFFIIILII